MSTQPKALFLADVIDNDPLSKAHHDSAAAELRRQHEEITDLRHGAGVANQTIASLVAQRDALKQTLHEELNGNLRLRDLGGARPDEPMLTFLERIIAERDALLRALNMAVQWVEEYASQMRAYTTSEQANADLSVIYAAIKMAEEGK